MPLRLGNDGPLYRRVYAALRDAILEGRLAAGARLPGTRTLARELGVSRIVVLAAFEQLVAEGYIVSARGAGTRVAVQVPPLTAPPARRGANRAAARRRLSGYAERARRLAPEAAPGRPLARSAGLVDFAYARAHPDAATLRAWRRALVRAAAEPVLDYPDAAGLPALREALVAHLREQRGVRAAAENVLIVNGAQQALDLAARVICDPGTRVAVEDPQYQGTRQALLAAGAKLVPCAVDSEGLDVEAHAARLDGVRAVCVTPSHQFPTGAVMSIERRLKLLDWAARSGAWVVEDDYDSEFRYGLGAAPALQGLDAADSVIYVGTFARTLFPGLRLGYIVAPTAMRDALRAAKWLADRGSAPLEQRALAAFMAGGAYESARRRLVRALGEKRRRLHAALGAQFAAGEIEASDAAAGTHVFLRLPRVRARDADALVEAARRRGVGVYSAAAYHLGAPRSATLICGYATVPLEAIDDGVRRFAEAYRACR